MKPINHAALKRVVERNNERLAEVAVTVDDSNQSDLVAYFGKDSRGEVNMRMAFRQEADFTIDWYDNSLHQAYKELNQQDTALEEEGLQGRILAYGNLRSEVIEALH